MLFLRVFRLRTPYNPIYYLLEFEPIADAETVLVLIAVVVVFVGEYVGRSDLRCFGDAVLDASARTNLIYMPFLTKVVM